MITPADLGITADIYSFCYCEENVYRAIRDIQKKFNVDEQENDAAAPFETFACFISSYNAPPGVCFPGSWLPHSRVVLVANPTSPVRHERSVEWDYHVVLFIRRKSDKAIFVADFDSALCNDGKRGSGKLERLVPHVQYCRVTFAQASAKDTFIRVVPGAEYLKTFSSTRAHMLPVPLLRQWLSKPEFRSKEPPAEILNEMPHATEKAILPSEGRHDLSLFINMSADSPVPGTVLRLADFIAGKF